MPKEPTNLTNINNLRLHIDELEDLSVRSANCIRNTDIMYVWQLCMYTEAELLKTKNFGRNSLREIKEILAELGLELGQKLSKESIKLLQNRG